MPRNRSDAGNAGMKVWWYVALVSCILLSLESSTVWGSAKPEQTVFESDPSQPITRPMPLPDAVLQILAEDNGVASCVKDNPIPSGRSLASWFAASEVHLKGFDEADLVVLPVSQGDSYMCFHSVEGMGWFWVFRQTGGQYELALKTAGLGLTVLDRRHNGYRDIQSGSQVGKFATVVSFRFENGRYREDRQNTEELK